MKFILRKKFTGVCLLAMGLGLQSLYSAMEGNVEVTVQSVQKAMNSSKLNEYRTVPDGAYVENLSLKAENESSNCYLKLNGRKLGLDDQTMVLRGGKLGSVDTKFRYDQTPHVFSITGKTPYVHLGDGQMQLADQTQNDLQTSTNNAPGLFSDVPAVPLQLRRDTLSADIRILPAEGVVLNFSGMKEDRNGTRPIGVTFGGNLVEVPEPVSYQTNKAGVSAALNTGMFNAMFSYDAVFFTNSIDKLTVDNPWRKSDNAISAAGASSPEKAQLGLPPDNQSHSITLAGGVNIPVMQSRLNASLSYTMLRQNDAFLAPTVNKAILSAAAGLGINLNPPRPSLDGKMNTLALNTSLSMRPLNDLAVSGKIRYYKVTNDTDELLLNQYVPYDSAYSTSIPKGNFNPAKMRRSLPIGYSKFNFGMDVSYQLLSSLGMGIGYEWERMSRKHREVSDSFENTLKAYVNFVPRQWIDFRPSYLHANRYYSHYNGEEVSEEAFPIGEGINVLGNMDDLRKFDEASRLRDIVGIKSSIYPLDNLTFGLEYLYRIDRYLGTLYGTQNETNHSIGLDADYAMSERLNLYGRYSREQNSLTMKSRYRAGGSATVLPFDLENNDWIGVNRDITDTYGFGSNAVLIKKKLDMDLSYDLSRSRGIVDSINPNAVSGTAAQMASAKAVNFRETETELHKLSMSLKWILMENLTARLRYQYERYMVEDYAFEFIDPWQPAWNTSLFLNSTQSDYHVHIVGLSLIYKF